MILRTRLQWLLAGSTVLFAFAALFAVVFGGGDETATTTTSSTTTLEETTTTTNPKTYVVKSGDSLFSIATQFGVSMEDLVALNGIVDVDKINAGEVLKLPPQTTTTTTESTTSTTETATTS